MWVHAIGGWKRKCIRWRYSRYWKKKFVWGHYLWPQHYINQQSSMDTNLLANLNRHLFIFSCGRMATAFPHVHVENTNTIMGMKNYEESSRGQDIDFLYWIVLWLYRYLNFPCPSNPLFYCSLTDLTDKRYIKNCIIRTYAGKWVNECREIKSWGRGNLFYSDIITRECLNEHVSIVQLNYT